MNDELLLSNKRHTNRLIEETKTKPQETRETETCSVSDHILSRRRRLQTC